jgi:hypothetical protein
MTFNRLIEDDAGWWTYQVRVDPHVLRTPAVRGPWLRDLVSRLVDAQRGFARVVSVDVNAQLADTEPLVSWSRGVPAKPPALSRVDVWSVDLELALQVRWQREPVELHAARLVIWIETDQQGTPDPRADHPVWISLTVNCNAYAGRVGTLTPEQIEGNHAALAHTLTRIDTQPDITFLHAESLSFADRVSRFGYRAPAPST